MSDLFLCRRICDYRKREISGSDTLIVAGTSLAVEPAASCLSYFHGRELVVINREETPADEKATLILRGDIGEALESAVREAGLSMITHN